MLSNEVKSITNAITRQIWLYNQGKNYNERIFLTCKRTQKLLFLFEIEYMKRHQGKSFFKDSFHAWPSGPAIPELYMQYDPIKIEMSYMDKSSEEDILSRVKLPCYRTPTTEEQQILDYILSLTVNMDTQDLVDICCENGSPWEKNYNPADQDHPQIIPKSEIYSYYSIRDMVKEILKLEDSDRPVFVVSPSDIGLCEKAKTVDEETPNNTPVIIVEP